MATTSKFIEVKKIFLSESMRVPSTKLKHPSIFRFWPRPIPGVSKVFARRATCGEMNIYGATFDYNTGHGPYSIHFMNQATRASQKLNKGRIWPAGWTLDMPALYPY